MIVSMSIFLPLSTSLSESMPQICLCFPTGTCIDLLNNYSCICKVGTPGNTAKSLSRVVTETLVILVCNVQKYHIRFLVALAPLVLLGMEKIAEVANSFLRLWLFEIKQDVFIKYR